MATSTNTLQRTVNLAQIFVKGTPLTGVQGDANEPALSIGDWVRQFMLSPPFAWRWNRNTTSFTTTAGTQDYTKSLSDFGWLEKATVTAASTVHELEVELNLGEETLQNLPTKIAARIDDGAGNITFRIFPVPDAIYTVNISYQKAAPSFGDLTDTWSPLPDYLSQLYNQGFVAKAYEYLGDDRVGLAMTMFVRNLISTNAGLTDSQVNIFLAERLNTVRSFENGSQVRSYSQQL